MQCKQSQTRKLSQQSRLTKCWDHPSISSQMSTNKIRKMACISHALDTVFVSSHYTVFVLSHYTKFVPSHDTVLVLHYTVLFCHITVSVVVYHYVFVCVPLAGVHVQVWLHPWSFQRNCWGPEWQVGCQRKSCGCLWMVLLHLIRLFFFFFFF